MAGPLVVDALELSDVEEHMSGEGQLVSWATLSEVPAGPGVYAWCVRGQRGTWCVVYIGVGARWRDGLRHRLRCELGWVLAAEAWSEEERPLRFSAHPRTMVKRQAQVWCWPTETAAAARQAEAELLELSVVEAAAPPLNTAVERKGLVERQCCSGDGPRMVGDAADSPPRPRLVADVTVALTTWEETCPVWGSSTGRFLIDQAGSPRPGIRVSRKVVRWSVR